MSQGTSYPYCNTTDLQLVDSEIEKSYPLEHLEGWTIVSGMTATYYYPGSGVVGAVFQNSSALTEKTSIATVEATASTWWYDSTNDLLYVHTSTGADPDTFTIQVATYSLKNYSDKMIYNAMEIIESYLDPSFNRPLPFAKNSYNSAKYDYDIVRSTALIACALIRKANNPLDPIAEAEMKEVWNPQEDSGILWDYIKGRRKFSFETSKDDFNGRLENVTLDAASTGRVYLSGVGDTSQHKIYRLKIDTAGAVETATYKLSDDNGITWYATLQKTYYEPSYLSRGLWVRFEGTFVADDEWKIEISSYDEQVNTDLFSVKLKRS